MNTVSSRTEADKLVVFNKIDDIKSNLAKRGVIGSITTVVGHGIIQMVVHLKCEGTDRTVPSAPIDKLISTFCRGGSNVWDVTFAPRDGCIDVYMCLDTSKLSYRELIMELDYKLCIIKGNT